MSHARQLVDHDSAEPGRQSLSSGLRKISWQLGQQPLVVPKECHPLSNGIAAPGSLRHVPGDRPLGHGEPKHQQLAVDPRRAPREVVACHAADQVADLGADPRATAAMLLRVPPPEARQADSVPPLHRSGLHDLQGFPPARPPSSEQDPESAVRPGEARAGPSSLEHLHLMAEGHVLQDKIRLGSPAETDEPEQDRQDDHVEPGKHQHDGQLVPSSPGSQARPSARKPVISRVTRFWRRTGEDHPIALSRRPFLR